MVICEWKFQESISYSPTSQEEHTNNQLHGLSISSCLHVPAFLSSCPDLFPQWTVIWKCKPNQPFPPQLAFGHGFIIAMVTLTNSKTIYWNTTSLSETIFLMKTKSLPQKQSLLSWGGDLMRVSPVHAGVWTTLILCGSCAYSHHAFSCVKAP